MKIAWRRNKMYGNLGYYTFPWNHIFVVARRRKHAVKRVLKGDASFPIHQHQGSNACHIMKDLRGRTIIMIIVFLGIKKFSEQNISLYFPSNHLCSSYYFLNSNVLEFKETI